MANAAPRNGFERVARLNKVNALVREIDRRAPRTTPATMAKHLAEVFTPACWGQLAKQAGCAKPPSETTILAVIAVFAARADQATEQGAA